LVVYIIVSVMHGHTNINSIVSDARSYKHQYYFDVLLTVHCGAWVGTKTDQYYCISDARSYKHQIFYGCYL